MADTDPSREGDRALQSSPRTPQRARGFLLRFLPETDLFRRGGVNLRPCLCGVPMYASAQALDFLATTKNLSFPDRKLRRAHDRR